MDFNLILNIITNEIKRGIAIGAFPGAIAGGLALPLMFGEGLVLRVVFGMLLGAIGMVTFEGIRVGDQLKTVMRDFNDSPQAAGELFSSLFYSLIQGVAIGALLLLAFFEIRRTLLGVLIGTAAGILVGVIFNLVITNVAMNIDPRTHGLIIGGIVGVLIIGFTTQSSPKQ